MPVGAGWATRVWGAVFLNLPLPIRHQDGTGADSAWVLLGGLGAGGHGCACPGSCPRLARPCPAAPTPTSLCFLSLRAAVPNSGSRRDEPLREKSTLIPGNNCP